MIARQAVDSGLTSLALLSKWIALFVGSALMIYRCLSLQFFSLLNKNDYSVVAVMTNELKYPLSFLHEWRLIRFVNLRGKIAAVHVSYFVYFYCL